MNSNAIDCTYTVIQDKTLQVSHLEFAGEGSALVSSLAFWSQRFSNYTEFNVIVSETLSVFRKSGNSNS